MTQPLGSISLERYPLAHRGKVREVFDLGDRFLFVATDRVSAFDVVLPTLIPDKGRLLTGISQFWFNVTSHIAPNHLLGTSLADLDLSPEERDALAGRSMVVRKAERIDIECVVREYLAGSGWEEYRERGTLAGDPLPAGLQPGSRLPELRFTPAVKNDTGHDENITVTALRERIGRNLTDLLEVTSKALFTHAQGVANRAGLVLADTKFEFGFVANELTLIDEALTPDSSRYWKRDDLEPGAAPQGYDKQLIRNWLLESGWDREPPGPELPPDIVAAARDRYREVLERLEATRVGTTITSEEDQ